jgi:LemA protein
MVNYDDKIKALREKNLLDEMEAKKLSESLREHDDLSDLFEEEPRKNHRMFWVGGIVLTVLLGTGVLYNGLVSKEEAVNVAWSQVESTMQRKLDLLPNLVKVVKAYAKHETQLLTNITALRANASQLLKSKDAVKLATLNKQMNASVMKLFAVAENYPNLKSSEQFLQLQAQIEGSENRINVTRMMFNEELGFYNSAIRKMPHKLIASVAGFEKRSYFKAEENAHKKLELGL